MQLDLTCRCGSSVVAAAHAGTVRLDITKRAARIVSGRTQIRVRQSTISHRPQRLPGLLKMHFLSTCVQLQPENARLQLRYITHRLPLVLPPWAVAGANIPTALETMPIN